MAEGHLPTVRRREQIPLLLSPAIRFEQRPDRTHPYPVDESK
jgi:hypothetical protein